MPGSVVSCQGALYRARERCIVPGSVVSCQGALRAERCTDTRANSIFSGPMCFDENPFTCQCEKGNKKAEGFQISHFYRSFSNEIMEVKGLK